MTWRRWALVLQILFACFLLFLVLRIELGFYVPPPGKLDMATVNKWVGGYAVYSIIAAVGILARKAWGYFLEIPLIPILILLVFLLPSRARDDSTFPWMNEAIAVMYTIWAVTEMWKCGMTGFRLLRKPPNSTPLDSESLSEASFWV